MAPGVVHPDELPRDEVATGSSRLRGSISFRRLALALALSLLATLPFVWSRPGRALRWLPVGLTIALAAAAPRC